MNKENNTSISICILRLSAIGDATHIIPIISTLQKHYKKADITWVIGKTEYELVKMLDNVNFIVIDKNKTLDSVIGMHKYLRKGNFDIVFHMQKSLRSKFLGRIINGKINVTFNDIKTNNNHVLDNFFSFLEKINIQTKELNWQTNKILTFCDSFIDETNIEEFKPFVAINPFTSERVNNYREWDYDNYGTISEYLFNEYSIKTVFVGKTTEERKNSFQKHIKGSSKLLNLINKTSLGEMLSVLNMSEFYIGPDSGTLHMANMLALPIIGLYATSNPKRTGAYSSLEYTVDRYEEALDTFSKKSIEKAKWGERVRDKGAMKLISLDDVKLMIKKVLSN
jgi:heptosyltransferase I